MSLTSLLRNPRFIKTLDNLIDQSWVDRFIGHQNHLLAKAKPVYPGNVNFPLIGMAATYALRGMILPLEDQLDNTVAGKLIRSYGFNPAEVIEQHDFNTACLGLAAIDSLARQGTPLNASIKKMIRGQNLFAGDSKTLQDFAVVCQNLQKIVRLHPELFKAAPYYPNPTFEGSNLVGGADAQMIVGRTLVDLKTTCKSEPFTKKDLYQQLCYIALDTSNRYEINQIAWVYSRQKQMIDLDIVRDLPGAFTQFLICGE